MQMNRSLRKPTNDMLGIPLLNVFAFVLLVALPPQVQPASIEGVVVRAGTSEPVANAIVELNGENGRPSAATATVSDGKFEFKNLTPGSYNLTVSRSGYLDGAYGRRGSNGSPAALALQAGQVVKNVILNMVPTGAISGRVYDISGEPLANVTVQAFKYSYGEGARVLISVKADQTNDRGEYRLFWLPPGQYYISASAQPAHSDGFFSISDASGHPQVLDSRAVNVRDNHPTLDKLGQAYAPIYYPGAADLQAAEALDLRPGADLRADFNMQRLTTHHIRGVVIDGTTGQPATSAALVLAVRQGNLRTSLRPIPGSDGSFEIPGVLPGSYVLSATLRSTGSSGSVRVLGGEVPIDVTNTDVERLVVVISPGVDIGGQIVRDAVHDSSGEQMYPAVVILKNELTGLPLAREFHSFFDSPSQFAFRTVLQGTYRVEITYLPAGTYVKSARFGGMDALNGSIRIEPGTTDRLQIVLGSGSGAVDGNIVTAKGERAANITVAVVPDASQRHRSDLYKSATTDTSGHFQIKDIPPGDYSVFAWEDIENGLWRDPDFIRRNENSARVIHIGDGTQANVELTAIPFGY